MPGTADGSSQVVLRLLAKCPELEPRWRQECGDHAEGLPYVQVTALARAIVEARRNRHTDCLGELLNEAERILVDGEREDRDLIVEGLLEDLQGAIGWAELDPAPFYELLGPKSKAAWDDLHRMWAVIKQKKALGELPPGPFESGLPEIKDPQLRTIFQSLYRAPAHGSVAGPSPGQMMDERLRSLVARMKLGAGTSPTSLAELASRLSLQLPADYVAFMVEADGGEGFVGEGGYLQVWSVEEIEPNNEALKVGEFAPLLVFFATDGGDEGYAFDRKFASPRVIQVPLIGMADRRHYVNVGATFTDLLENIGQQSG